MTTHFQSTDGKYTPGNNQVAFTDIEGVHVSTIWWKTTDEYGDFFETMVFDHDKVVNSMTRTYSSEIDAIIGHGEVVSEVSARLSEGNVR